MTPMTDVKYNVELAERHPQCWYSSKKSVGFIRMQTPMKVLFSLLVIVSVLFPIG